LIPIKPYNIIIIVITGLAVILGIVLILNEKKSIDPKKLQKSKNN
jgi:uncharacterized membrane protein (DUF106 family)